MLDLPTIPRLPFVYELLISLNSPIGDDVIQPSTTSVLKNLSNRSFFFSSGSTSANLPIIHMNRGVLNPCARGLLFFLLFLPLYRFSNNRYQLKYK